MGREIICTEVGGWSVNKFCKFKSANFWTYKIWYICGPSANVAIADPTFFLQT